MTKCIVKTTGQFMLLTRSEPIKVGVATVVEKDEFVSSRIRNGDLALIQDNLPMRITQQDLVAAGSVSALMLQLEAEDNPEPPLTPPTKAKNTKKAG